MVDRNDPKALAAWEERQRSKFESYGVSKLLDVLRDRQVGGPEIEKFVRDKLLPEMRKNETAAREAQVAEDTRRYDEMRAIAQTAVDHAATANEHVAEANEIAEQARDEARKSVKASRRGVWVALAAVIIALIALLTK